MYQQDALFSINLFQ